MYTYLYIYIEKDNFFCLDATNVFFPFAMRYWNMDSGKFFNHYALPLCFLLVSYENKYSDSVLY